MIQQWSRNDGAWQQFQFVSSGGGYYRLKARHSGKVVDLWEWNTADGADYRQWPDLNATNQQFQVLDSDGGYVRLVNRHSAKALEVGSGPRPTAAGSVQYTDVNGANQQWQLVAGARGRHGHRLRQRLEQRRGRAQREHLDRPQRHPDGLFRRATCCARMQAAVNSLSAGRTSQAAGRRPRLRLDERGLADVAAQLHDPRRSAARST